MDILDKKVADLSKILEKLRSVSTKGQDLSKSSNETSYGDWKVCCFDSISQFFFFFFLL